MKISLSENRKPIGEQTLRQTGKQLLRPTGERLARPFRRERESIRYKNIFIPNYLYNEYPIHRQFVTEKEVINQNDYSNFFIIIIIILLVSSILIYTKI